jgi:N utilization substance protein A
MEIEGFDEKIAEELRERALVSLKEKEEGLIKDIEKMGISNELSQFDGLNPAILVKLGSANIKTVDNLADLASDELLEILEDISLTSKEADEIIMRARASWFEDGEKKGTSTRRMRRMRKPSRSMRRRFIRTSRRWKGT